MRNEEMQIKESGYRIECVLTLPLDADLALGETDRMCNIILSIKKERRYE